MRCPFCGREMEKYRGFFVGCPQVLKFYRRWTHGQYAKKMMSLQPWRFQ